MPELPEVHGYQTYLNSTILHKKIVAMECRDARLLKQPINDFREHLLGNKFTATRRIGKYLFLETNGDKILVIHHGMTGKPTYYKDPESRPKFGHIVLAFDNYYHYAFENKRKFGWWDLTDSIEKYQNENKLSTDARELTWDEFKASLNNRSTHIKKILMDQSVAAGVGNWMADEILYQSRIHPEMKLENMSPQDVKKVFETMHKVIETAIEHDAHYSDFPQGFLMHFRKEGAACYHTDGTIEKIKVGGRTTYFSPTWQQL
jgi:formamidopyrimidine-DNA glycosylase